MFFNEQGSNDNALLSSRREKGNDELSTHKQVVCQ
jgi:hypothetical protein